MALHAGRARVRRGRRQGDPARDRVRPRSRRSTPARPRRRSGAGRADQAVESVDVPAAPHSPSGRARQRRHAGQPGTPLPSRSPTGSLPRTGIAGGIVWCEPDGHHAMAGDGTRRLRVENSSDERCDDRSPGALTGTVLSGRYRLESKLGSGGMSTVYLARDETLERWVAAKVLHREISDQPDQIERFRREARAVAQVSHPNVVAVIDAGEDGGHPYIVFEYCRRRDAEAADRPPGPAAARRGGRLRDRGRPRARRRPRARGSSTATSSPRTC